MDRVKLGLGWAYLSLFSRSRFRLIAVLSLLLISLIYLLPPTALVDGYQRHVAGESHDSLINAPIESVTDRPLPLPAPYAHGSEVAETAGLCNDRYGTNYIRAFSRTATAYCDVESTANLTCFSHKADDTRIDSFCIGIPATVDPLQTSIQLDCNLRNWEGETVPRFQQFPTYWYGTGPHAIFNQYVKLGRAADLAPGSVAEVEGYSFLIKREDNHQNLWHTMMSIMSLTMSLDVLRTTADPSTGNPFFTDLDQERSQVVFLDGLEDGPFYDLWTIFARMPSVRLNDVALPILKHTKIVVPLPGGSNPFWQGDWEEIDCGESALLKTFSRRVLDFYNIADSSPRSEGQLSLTLIDRKQKRRLTNKDAYFTTLQAKYPQIKMQVVDFAALPLLEQIRFIHATDILVGVHGAGLTHGMFLPANSTIVEILPPSLMHKGFDNMSKFLGHNHFSRHGSKHESADNTGDWQHDDVYLDEEEFMRLMDEAIASATG